MKEAIANFLSTYSRYPKGETMPWTKGVPLGHFIDRVSALDVDTCTREEMAKALGKDLSWGANPCDHCGQDSSALMRFGDEPDYDARWQDLCAACLQNAAKELS